MNEGVIHHKWLQNIICEAFFDFLLSNCIVKPNTLKSNIYANLYTALPYRVRFNDTDNTIQPYYKVEFKYTVNFLFISWFIWIISQNFFTIPYLTDDDYRWKITHAIIYIVVISIDFAIVIQKIPSIIMVPLHFPDGKLRIEYSSRREEVFLLSSYS